jgi:protein-tyrosine kinase
MAVYCYAPSGQEKIMTTTDESSESTTPKGEEGKGSPANLPVIVESSSAADESLHMEEEMLGLYQSIESMLPHCPRKIIQFIGSQEGEGTSTIAGEFARAAAFKIGKSVLLLDADRVRPSHQHFFPVRLDTGWLEAVKSGRGSGGSLYHVQNSGFFDGPSLNSEFYGTDVFLSASIDSFWNLLRHRFDLIVIDSPPLTQSQDGLSIAPKVDGVVIVIEAERTRWTVAESVKKRIGKMGGNILGIVFNKRRYYIPQSIYERLR